MFDTHAHLAAHHFDKDRTEVIKNAVEQGIEGIICICSDFEELDVFYKLLEEYNFIYGAVGIHPHDASSYKRLQEKLSEVLTNDKIVALGEIGLDYYYENSPRDIQKEAFILQLTLAKQRDLPVIIHTRCAMRDTLEILKDKGIRRGVMHCFSGEEDDMRACLDMGLYISIAGPVTFPKAARLQNIARLTPQGRLLVETDSPYLAPQPVRGKRNEPSFVKYIVQKISSLRKITEDKLRQIISQNAKELFKIP